MKKFISLALSVATAATLFATSASAMTGNENHGKVPATDVAITVDGKKDAIYDKGLEIKIDVPLASKKAECTSGCTGVAKVVWNGKDTIYVYAEVKDANPVSSNDAKPTTPWSTDDSIECFVDPKNDGKTRYQLAMTAKGAGYSWISKLEYDQAALDTIGYQKYAAVKTDTGYAYEWQIKATGFEAKDGAVIGFGFQINDIVNGKRQQYVSNKKGGEAITDFGEITLSSTKVALDAPKTSTAAKTADITSVLALTAISTMGVLVAAKKKH